MFFLVRVFVPKATAVLMIYVRFTIICASILQDDDQGESVALSLLCSGGNPLMEFLINYVCK